MDPKRKRHFKDEIFGQFARIGQALGSGRRLELLDVLAQGARTVDELAREAGMSVANASQHLQVLRRARLVESRQSGTYVFYRLADARVFRLWQALRELGEERLAEVDHLVRDYLERRDELEPISMADLLGRMKEVQVLVLDVRPRAEYEAGHIAGARSVPIEEIEAMLPQIPPGAEIVAYCRGPYCVFADEAVSFLRERGVPGARRLDLGYPDWQAAGLPVESEEEA
jgi:rhodanese-related sulfurtransferase/DNA-binding transcriptional ArsR family regulator